MCTVFYWNLSEYKLPTMPYFDAKSQDSILNPRIAKIALARKLGEREKRVYSNTGFRGKPRATLSTKLDEDLVNYFNKTEPLKDHRYID